MRYVLLKHRDEVGMLVTHTFHNLIGVHMETIIVCVLELNTLSIFQQFAIECKKIFFGCQKDLSVVSAFQLPAISVLRMNVIRKRLCPY